MFVSFAKLSSTFTPNYFTMSRIYPSLEDLKVDEATRMQQNMDREVALNLQKKELTAAGYNNTITNQNDENFANGDVYQILKNHLDANGSDLHNLPLDPPPRYEPSANVVNHLSYLPGMAIPVSNHGMLGMKRAEIRPGIRSVVLCKDEDGILGVRIRAINEGVFIAFVKHGAPAALGGLRFGDQILQINNETVAGYGGEKVMKILKEANPRKITMAVRDRPFQRTITLQKDYLGRVGLVFKWGKVVALVRNSSAARNGLLTNQYICEVNGQCVVGLQDKEIEEIILNCGPTVTVTLMPIQLYERIVKKRFDDAGFKDARLYWSISAHYIPDALPDGNQ